MKISAFTPLLFLFLLCTRAGIAQKADLPNLKFIKLTDIPFKLTWPVAITDGKYLYAMNGLAQKNSAGFSGNLLKYDPQADSWTVLSHNAGFKVQAAGVYLPETKQTYVFGGAQIGTGAAYASVQRADLQTGAITDLNLINPAAAIASYAVAWNHQIYIFGGTRSGHSSSSMYRFNPQTNEFSQLNNMPKTMETTGAVVDGVLYTFGGFDQFLNLSTADINAYDIKSNTWATIAKLPKRVSSNCIAVYGHFIFVIGDYDQANFLGYFDTRTKKFTLLKSNMEGRRAAGAAVIGHKLYVYGGKTGYIQKVGGGSQTLQSADLSQLGSAFTE